MFHVSAGRRLRPASWPGGARVAVALSFDVDNASAAPGDRLPHSSDRQAAGRVSRAVWQFSRFTMQQVKDAGFLYDSSLMASDDAYEILLSGKPTWVIELPIGRILDDFPYFGAASGSLPSAELVLEVFQSEFDVAYQEGGLYILTMHPHIMGHRSRVAVLDRLIEYMRAKPGVWFATHEQVAWHVRGSMATP